MLKKSYSGRDLATKCFTLISRRATKRVRSLSRFELLELVFFLAPGQMKSQKKATALRLQIEEVKQMQAEALNRAREDEMRREGIPISKSDRDAYSDRRYTKRDDRDDRRRGRRDRSRDREISRFPSPEAREKTETIEDIGIETVSI
jgi:hypothetical protein